MQVMRAHPDPAEQLDDAVGWPAGRKGGSPGGPAGTAWSASRSALGARRGVIVREPQRCNDLSFGQLPPGIGGLMALVWSRRST